MILVDLIKIGCTPHVEVYREMLGINHDFLFGHDKVEIVKREMHASYIRRVESSDAIFREKSPLGHGKDLNLKQTEKYIKEKIIELNEKGKINTLVSLLCAIQCLKQSDNYLLINKLFVDNINNIIEEEKNRIKINKVRNFDEHSNLSNNNKFDIFSYSDPTMHEIWIRLLGEYSLHYQTPDLKKYLKIVDEKFLKTSQEVALYHRNLLIFSTSTSTTTSTLIPSSGSNSRSISKSFPLLSDNDDEKQNVNKSENKNEIKNINKNENKDENHNIFTNSKSNIIPSKSIENFMKLSNNLNEKGIPLLIHYDMMLQGMKRAEKHEEMKEFQEYIQNENYEIKKNKNIDIQSLFKCEIKEYLIRFYNIKNEREMLEFGINIAGKVIANDCIAGSLLNCSTDKEFYLKKYANFTIINLLEESLKIAIKKTKNPKTITTTKSYVNEETQEEMLKNVVLLFNAISVCNFPHSTLQYVNLLNLYLRVMDLDCEAHKEKIIANGLKKRIIEQQEAAIRNAELISRTQNSLRSDNIAENMKQEDKNKKENEIVNENEGVIRVSRGRIRSLGTNQGNTLIRQYVLYDDHNNNEKQTDDDNSIYFNQSVEMNMGIENKAELEPKLESKLESKSEEKLEFNSKNSLKSHKIEILTQAVDLFEDILATNRKLDLPFWRMLIEGIIATPHCEQLLYRLYLGTPFSFWYKAPLKYKLAVIFKMLFLLEKYDELLLFAGNISSVNQTRVQDEFQNILNWEKIIKSLSILKKIENANLLISETEQQESYKNNNYGPVYFSYHQSAGGHPFYRYSQDTNKPKKKSNITEIDQQFNNLLKNTSKLRVFVDNDILILSIVDLFIENDLPQFAFKFLHECLDCCKFSKPKSNSQLRKNLLSDDDLDGKKQFMKTILKSGISNINTENEVLIQKLESLRKLRDSKLKIRSTQAVWK